MTPEDTIDLWQADEKPAEPKASDKKEENPPAQHDDKSECDVVLFCIFM